MFWIRDASRLPDGAVPEEVSVGRGVVYLRYLYNVGILLANIDKVYLESQKRRGYPEAEADQARLEERAHLDEVEHEHALLRQIVRSTRAIELLHDPTCCTNLVPTLVPTFL